MEGSGEQNIREAWEVYEELLKNEDYPVLVEHCAREVARHPGDLHAQERLGEAYVLNGQYQKAIEAMGEVHRKFPHFAESLSGDGRSARPLMR